MKVHHLNCGTMRPAVTPSLVCHVLAVETTEGLLLVDSGFGLRDAAEPAHRIGAARHLIRPVLDPEESAVRQLQRLDLDPDDVRDIVLTHYDADHSGGTADFPRARVHLTATESEAAQHPRTWNERSRYLPAQREHGPRLVEHDPATGDGWRGFAAATEIVPGVVLIAMPGHTRGHAAVAVDTGDGWILHAGDAFYHRAQIDGVTRGNRALATLEAAIAHDRRLVRANHARLAELWAAADPALTIVNAHDPELLRAAAAHPRRLGPR
ncbi:glyoxylase-like metal-dependent hydrolase (beta-lactamase superfamily II) [Actinoplanes campanulatus]|uniref:Glyoxylase-like metal-dependent hydrolase (Beta-lactamase superfamily II) n=1 Tax=Actinoplanes campanulatus TaxID=113559 RepID=A0A7W5AE58_9ACTN|nr:MBL fold metallo-hydrolase [Actinoplanes campanulatus]MBB3094139.1 glyoxylase-like metal-dependent hydrolase (beta-lactamase superfamily II) [Actinoplanes campanulatus]